MLDVRPILAGGDSPLEAILGTAAEVPPGGFLVIDAPFEPVPLEGVLETQGFEVHASPLAADHWRLYCRRVAAAKAAGATLPSGYGARIWIADGTIHIDVRGLEPPMPLLAIIELIEQPRCSTMVIAHLDRDPIHLYPELAERRWSPRPIAAPADEFRLELRRVTS